MADLAEMTRMAGMPLVVQPHPFSAAHIDAQVPAGATIADAVAAAGLPAAYGAHVRVWVDEWEVPRALWATARPKAGRVVYVKVFPHGGGGGGGKNPLATVLSLAVMFVAPQMAPALYSAMGGTFVAANAGFMISAIGMGVGMLGNMAINALIAPPSSSAMQTASGNWGQTAPSYQITGSNNQFKPYAPIPRVLGRRENHHPLHAARPYTEAQGKDRYVRMLLLAGYGPLSISNIRIGQTPIEAFDGVEIEIHEGGPDGWAGNTDITLYTQSIREDALSVELTEVGGWQTRTTRTDTAEISIDISFSRGLITYAADGTRGTRTVVFEVAYRAVGSGTWLTPEWTNATDSGMGVDGVITASEATQSSALRGARWFTGAAGQYEVRIRRTTPAGGDRDVDNSTWSALRSIQTQTPVRQQNVCLIAIRIKAGEQLNGVPDTVNCTAEAWHPVWNGTTWAWEKTRNPAWEGLDLLRRRGGDSLIADTRLYLPAWSALAVACDATPPTGTGPYWTYDGVIEGGSIYNALRDVLAHARATPTMRDGKHSVVIDAAQSVPVQHITPRNSWAYSGSKKFIDLPHALHVKFTNPAKSGAEDVVTVYADGYTEETATRFEQVEYYGCTRSDQAWRIGRYLLAVGQLRPEEHSVYLDIESLRCTMGDLVRFNHHVIQVGLGSGRISAMTIDAGMITGVSVDSPVEMAAGLVYAIRCRRSDGVSVVMAVDTAFGEQADLTISNPIPEALGPAVGDLFMFGEAGLDSMPCIVKRIEPGPQLTARLALVDAAPSVLTADGGTIPAFSSWMSSGLSPRQQVPTAPVFDLRSDESALLRLPDGSMQDRIAVSFVPPLASEVPVSGYEVRWRESEGSAWSYLPAVKGATATAYITPVLLGASYVVSARSISEYGQPSGWAESAPHVVAGKTTQMVAVTGATATGAMFSNVLQWGFALDARGFASTEVWVAGVNNRDVASLLGREAYPRARFEHLGLAPGQGWYYWLRVLDRVGNPSLWYPASATAGLYAAATTDPSALLTQLRSSLGMEQLAAELATPIAQVPDAMQAAQSAAEAALNTILKADELKRRAIVEKWVTDATVTIDPVTGRVTLLATAEISTDVEAQLNSVQLQLGAMDASLIGHTSTLTVHGDRIATAETDVAQLQGDIIEKASTSYVDGQIAGALGSLDPAVVDAASQSGAEGLLQTLLDADASRRQAIMANARVASAERTLATQADAIVAEAIERLILAAQVSGNAAGLVSEASARATADSALALLTTTLQARLDSGDYAAVKMLAEASADDILGLSAQHVLQVDVNGHVAGQKLAADETGSAVVWLADKFLWVMPDGTGAPKQIMIVGMINGTPALGFDGNLVVDGSLVARSLAAKTITAASGVIDDAAILSANIGIAVVDTLHVADGAITLSAFASDNGFARYFTVGTFTPGSILDTFSTVSFATRLGDDITVDAFCFVNTSDYGSALDAVSLRPILVVDGSEVSGGVSVTWRTYDNTKHIAISLKAKVAGTGGTRTAQLKIDAVWGAFTNSAYSRYVVSNCVLSAFIRRR